MNIRRIIVEEINEFRRKKYFLNEIHVPSSFTEIDKILQGTKQNIKQYAIISADNPCGCELTREENDLQREELIKDINSMGYTQTDIVGNFFNNEEKSSFIYNMDIKDAIELGVKYKQYSIIHGFKNYPIRTNDLRLKRKHPDNPRGFTSPPSSLPKNDWMLYAKKGPIKEDEFLTIAARRWNTYMVFHNMVRTYCKEECSSDKLNNEEELTTWLNQNSLSPSKVGGVENMRLVSISNKDIQSRPTDYSEKDDRKFSIPFYGDQNRDIALDKNAVPVGLSDYHKLADKMSLDDKFRANDISEYLVDNLETVYSEAGYTTKELPWPENIDYIKSKRGPSHGYTSLTNYNDNIIDKFSSDGDKF